MYALEHIVAMNLAPGRYFPDTFSEEDGEMLSEEEVIASTMYHLEVNATGGKVPRLPTLDEVESH